MNNYRKPCGIMEFKDSLDNFFYCTLDECKKDLEKPKTIWNLFDNPNKNIEIVSHSINKLADNIKCISLVEEDVKLVDENTFSLLQGHMGNLERELSSLFPNSFKKTTNGDGLKEKVDWLNKCYTSKKISYEKFKVYLVDFRLLIEKKDSYFRLSSELKFKQNLERDFVAISLKVAAVLKEIVKLKSKNSTYLNDRSNLIDPMIIENMKLNEIVDSFHLIIETEMKKWVSFISSCSQDAWRDVHAANYFKLVDAIPYEAQKENTKIYEFLIVQSEKIYSILRKKMFECEFFKIKNSHEACARILKVFLEKNWQNLTIKETSEGETVRGLNKYIKQFQEGSFIQFEVDVCRSFNFNIYENSKIFDTMPPIENILKSDDDDILDDNDISDIKKAMVLETQLVRLQSALKIEENNKWLFPLLMILNQGTIISACADLFPLNPYLSDDFGVDFINQSLQIDVERPTVFKIDLIKDVVGVIQEIKISVPYSMYCYQKLLRLPPVMKNLVEGSAQFSLKLDSGNLPYIENYTCERNWNSKTTFNG